MATNQLNSSQYADEGAVNVQPSAPPADVDVPPTYATVSNQVTQPYIQYVQAGQQPQTYIQPQQGQHVQYVQPVQGQPVQYVQGQAIVHQGYQPPQNVIVHPTQPQVIVANPVVNPPRKVVSSRPTRRSPQELYCPKCQTARLSKVYYVTGMGAHASACCIFCVGGALGCCLIPYCINECKDAEHHCSVCNTFIGTWPVLNM